ncbi:restriction endonuclease [Litorivicinus sp.]|nr:restriction endonuclease [Litorivicinus sp.]
MMSELERLRSALRFLTSHVPGVSELTELIENDEATLNLETNHASNPVQELIGHSATNSAQLQEALDKYKKRNHSKLEIGRFYERYLGYLFEQKGYQVAYKGIVEGLEDLGRDLICRKENEHLIVQAKCWSQRSEIHVKHIYQLHSSMLHYRFELREALKAAGAKQSVVRERMKEQDVKAVLYSTTSLSDMASEVVKHLNNTEYRIEPLNKDYPMVKCNISKKDGSKRFHLPWDPQYDSIVIGNVSGEFYCDTIAEAESAGFLWTGN